MSTQRLEGLDVVEICNAIAGPYAGRILAENGATVTRVEPITGSIYRDRLLWYDAHEHDEYSYRFLTFNTGKRSVAVDLKSEGAGEILESLIAEADVLIENLRAGAFTKLGFDWDTIQEINPEIVYCSITGYGEDGPYEKMAAYDPAVQAIAGWSDQTGDDERPGLMKIPVLDHATAMTAVNGILMSVIERATTNEGQMVEVAMLDVAVSYLGHYFAERSAAEAHDSVEAGYDMNIIEPGGIYETGDGYLTMIVVPEYWEPFCEAIDREEYVDADHRFATNDGRLANESELTEAIEGALAERTADQWVEYLGKNAPGVVCAQVNSVAEVFTDPQVQHRDLVQSRDHPELGEYYAPEIAPRFSGGEIETSEPPGLGEHTTEVLRSIGYEERRIRELRDAGVVK